MIKKKGDQSTSLLVVGSLEFSNVLRNRF